MAVTMRTMGREHYTVLLLPEVQEPGRYTVMVPSLPGCITEGDTLEEALARVRELIPEFIAAMRDAGEPIPHEPMPATVLLDAIANAQDILRACMEEMQESGAPIPPQIPEPQIATVEIEEPVTV